MKSEESKGVGGKNGGSVVFAFEVRVRSRDWSQIINARSAGKAKAAYHRHVADAWPDVPFTAMRCKKLGAPHTSERFKHNARYRGMPDVRCGQRVRVGVSRGVIVGHNESANFNILFDDDDPRFPGLTLNVHPTDVELVPTNGGVVR